MQQSYLSHVSGIPGLLVFIAIGSGILRTAGVDPQPLLEFTGVSVLWTVFLFSCIARQGRVHGLAVETVPFFAAALLYLTALHGGTAHSTIHALEGALYGSGTVFESLGVAAVALSMSGKRRAALRLVRIGAPLAVIAAILYIAAGHAATSVLLPGGTTAGVSVQSLLIKGCFDGALFRYVSIGVLAGVFLTVMYKKNLFRRTAAVLVVWAGGTGAAAHLGLLLLHDIPQASLGASILLLASRLLLLGTAMSTAVYEPYERLLRHGTRARDAEAAARKRAEKRARELDALRANLTDMLAEHEPPRLLSAILDRAVKLLDASGGEVGLFDEKRRELVVAASSLRERVPGERIGLGEGVLGTVAQKLEPLMLHGYGIGEARLPPYPHNQWYGIMAVPLSAGNRLVGAVMVVENNPVREFTPADLHLFRLFAQQAALAIRNTQLLDSARHRAETDSLTGLYNHGYFFDRARQEVDRARRYHHVLSALMFDIDHFKNVNDTWGHPTGDRVLVAISHLCRQLFRKVDIIGRYGGEEFAVLLPETGSDLAFQAAERLRWSVASMLIAAPQGRLSVTVSVGIATLTRWSTPLNDLLEQADKALYNAKHGGRNRCCVWHGSSHRTAAHCKQKRSGGTIRRPHSENGTGHLRPFPATPRTDETGGGNQLRRSA